MLLDVKDAGMYAEYARRATEIESRYGAVPLMAAAAEEITEGEWPAERTVVLEFPSLDDARSWYRDPEYQELIPMRQAATDSKLLIIGGFSR